MRSIRVKRSSAGHDEIFGVLLVGITPPLPISHPAGSLLAGVASMLLVQPHAQGGGPTQAMKLSSFEALAGSLETTGVRYLIAGGLAVAAHIEQLRGMSEKNANKRTSPRGHRLEPDDLGRRPPRQD
jgi:hypothetical protein